MGLDKTKRRKKNLPLELQDIPSFESYHEYEHRTVNSIADESEFLSDAPAVPTKRKRRPGFIDSEVDLMRTPEVRPPLNMSLFRRPLSIIKEHVSDNELVGKATKNRRKQRKKSAVSAKSEVTKTTPSKVKKTAPNMTVNTPAIGSLAAAADKYPILNDTVLVKRFLKVDFSNNQKGRIRQVLKDILRGTSPTILPEVINNKIQAILKSSENLTDTELRKIRVLYNMLKKVTDGLKIATGNTDSEDIFKDKKSKSSKELQTSKPKKKKVKEALGMKRYVVFVGNLPLNVTREQILNHFAEVRDFIRDVRIPQLADDKKSSYAYVELDNAPVYEMALSKHHSMMGSKRINVLYTTPNKKSKISKTEAKAKSAKLVAMSKKGTLIGSVPQQRKRSHRRAKARAAQKAAERQGANNKK